MHYVAQRQRDGCRRAVAGPKRDNTRATPCLWITGNRACAACWGVGMAVHQTNDLRRVGIGPTQLRRMVRDRELERLRRGAYADPEVLEQAARHLRLIEATIPQLGGDVILSHASAGIIHGLPVPEALLGQVWVTGQSKGGGHSRPALHELKAALLPGDVVGLGPLKVTSLARTVVDLGRRLRFDDTVVAADAALHAGLDPNSLAEQLDAWPRRRGIGLARKALALADGRSESPGETRSRILMWRAGLASPDAPVRGADHRRAIPIRFRLGGPPPAWRVRWPGEVRQAAASR